MNDLDDSADMPPNNGMPNQQNHENFDVSVSSTCVNILPLFHVLNNKIVNRMKMFLTRSKILKFMLN